jgi:sporulation-control protein spo0M
LVYTGVNVSKGVHKTEADFLQNETDPLLKQVFMYDFVNEHNLGW